MGQVMCGVNNFKKRVWHGLEIVSVFFPKGAG